MIYYIVVWLWMSPTGEVKEQGLSMFQSKFEACLDAMEFKHINRTENKKESGVFEAEFDGPKILWTKPVTCAAYKP